MANSDSVEVTVGGKTYTGTYTVSASLITVRYAGTSKTTQIGANADATARLLLHELVQSHGASQ